MAAHWSYNVNGETGPSHWGEQYETANGSHQSPIDIDTSKAKTVGIGEFTLTGFDDSPSGSELTLTNNGHSAQVNVTGDYFVAGGGLPTKYKVAQFHFHWGSNNKVGSEHTVDGKQYAAELHFVTYNPEKFSSLTEATVDSDGVAVLGSFLEVCEETNSAYEPLLAAFDNITYKGGSHTFEQPFPFRHLMPENMKDFYRYNGSLTTPGCQECVIWTLFKETIKISEAQIAKFRTLIPIGMQEAEGITHLEDNFRPVQPLNDRVVTTTIPAKTTTTEKIDPVEEKPRKKTSMCNIV
ncbi:carbonic anhydrase 3-like [Glandiceps talaboti]